MFKLDNKRNLKIMNSGKKNFNVLLKDVFSSEWRYGTKILYLGILSSFSLILIYNLSKGYVMSPDSHGYSRWADELINLNLNLKAYYSENTFIAPKFLYTIPVILVTLSKLLFGSGWQNAFMFFNLIFVFFSLILFSKGLLLLKVRPLAIAFAMPLLTLSFDLLLWPKYILTDTVFSFLIMLLVYFVIKSIVDEKFYYLYLIFFIILLLVTRPSSLPYIFAVVVFILFIKFKINFNPKIIISIFIFLFVLIPFCFTILFQFMEIYLSGTRKADYLIGMVKEGMIIRNRPETYLESPETFIDIFVLYFVRLVYFFSPYTKNFSLVHIILNTLQTFVVFSSIIIWSFFGKKNFFINKTVGLILIISISVAAFHSFMLIDYDWRFRFPIIIPLLMFFPISLEIILRRMTNEGSKNK